MIASVELVESRVMVSDEAIKLSVVEFGRGMVEMEDGSRSDFPFRRSRWV
jgi:hypothetical protein